MKFLIPAQVSSALERQNNQKEALFALRHLIERVMARAAASVLLSKPKSEVTEAEARGALIKINQLPNNDPQRAKAERAAWRAVADNPLLRCEIFPEVFCNAISFAFSALDVGMALGLATPEKNARPATAVNRDALAKIVALEVEYHKALLGLEHDTQALMLVTGVSNPETPNITPDEAAVTLNLFSITWKQANDLLRGGRKLIDPLEISVIQDAAYAVASGLARQEQVLPAEQLEARRLFADPAWRHAFIVDNFKPVEKGSRSKPRAKKRAARKTQTRKPAATRDK